VNRIVHWRVSPRKPQKCDGKNFMLAVRPPTGLVTEDGKTVKARRISSGTESWAEAETIATDMQRDLNAELLRTSGPELMTVDDVMEWRKRRKGAPQTIVKLGCAMKHLSPRIGHLTSDNLSEADILSARDALEELMKPDGTPALCNRTINQYLRQFAGAWRKALKRKLVSAPWPKLERLDESDTEKRNFRKEEAPIVFDALGQYQDGWLYAFFALLWDGASRVTETTYLRERDIDRASGRVRFTKTKSGKPRTAFVLPETLALIPKRKPDEFLFLGKRSRTRLSRRTVTGALNRVLRKIGLEVKRLDVHSMRRSWVTDAVRTPNVAIEQAMKHTGHGKRSRQVFLDYQDRAEDNLKDVADRVRASRSFVPARDGKPPHQFLTGLESNRRGSPPANPPSVTLQSHTPLSCCREF